MQGAPRVGAGMVQLLLGHEQLPEDHAGRGRPVDLPGAVDEQQAAHPALARGAQAKGGRDTRVVDAADGRGLRHLRSMRLQQRR